jgi:HAE1 family hydrophobic/amphiphilic exporter-1
MVIVGFISFQRLPIDFLPEQGYPKLTVITNYPNSTPADVEKMVTRPIEESVSTLSKVNSVSSISREGISIVTINYDWGTDMGYASLDLREKLDNVVYQLPQQAERSNIIHLDPADQAIMQLAIYSENTDSFLLQQAAENHLKNRLQQLDGVAQAEVIGTVEREIQIKFDEARLISLGLDVNTVSKIISASSYNFSGGRIKENHNLFYVKINAMYNGAEDIKNTLVTSLKNGRHIYVKDIAQVTDTFKDRTNLTYYNGLPALGIMIRKESQSNTIEVSKLVNAELEKLRSEFEDIKIIVISDQAIFIQDSINSVLEAIIYGGLLAFLVLFLFLGGWRNPLNISIAIPISIMITFILMYFSKISLNIISLSGLALGIGMLVDNSIVVSENIFRHSSTDSNKINAFKGTKEVSLAITASTLTTLAVFLPLLFIKGLASSLFKQQALTVTFSLVASLLVSITFLPMLASLGESKKKKTMKVQKGFARITCLYLGLLENCLKRRALVLALFIILFIASLTSFFFIPKSFFPDISQDQLSAVITCPPGTSLEQTKEVAFNVDQMMQRVDGYKDSFITVGKSSEDKLTYFLNDASKENIAEVVVNLLPGYGHKEVIPQLDSKLIPYDVNIIFKAGEDYLSSLFESEGRQLKLIFKGEELGNMLEYAKWAKASISKEASFSNIQADFEIESPLIRLRLNREVANRYGLSLDMLADYISTNLNGLVVSSFEENNLDYDVKVFLDKDITISGLEEKMITQGQHTIKLKDLFTTQITSNQEEIKKESQIPQLEISFDYSGKLESALKTIQPLITNSPDNMQVSIEGVNQEIDNSLKSLMIALISAIILIYMILASQFESLKLPFIIMFVVPMGIIGVALALIITGTTINIMSTLGILVLSGIIVNDAILLVDFSNHNRMAGMNPYDSVITAAKYRFRPIIMTTITTVLGLLPLAIGIGSGAELQSSMAIALVGGMLIATLLTLIIIPILYTIIERRNK